MLIALGIDVVDTQRIATLLQRHREHFTELVLSERELALVKSDHALVPFVAGRWAAKEAIMKALGEGIGILQMPEIEVLRSPNGAAQVVLNSKALALAQSQNIRRWQISISHERIVTVAVACALSE